MKLFVKDLLMLYNGAGTVVEFGNLKELTEAGSYDGYVPFDGVYKLEIVGSGGKKANNGVSGYASGASGGAIVCELYLKSGYYTVEIEENDDNVSSIEYTSFISKRSNTANNGYIPFIDRLVARAWNGGSAYRSGISAVKGTAYGETGGEVSSSYKIIDDDGNVITVNTQATENELDNDGVGNDGSAKNYSYPEGGESVYKGYGKGEGKNSGTDGYFKLTYLRKNI